MDTNGGGGGRRRGEELLWHNSSYSGFHPSKIFNDTSDLKVMKMTIMVVEEEEEGEESHNGE